MKLSRITNPLWLTGIAPRVDDFIKKIKPAGITYDTLMAYFRNSVQFGGNLTELWVVFDDGKPVAFSHWFVKGLPTIGTVFCDFIYSWTPNREAARLLYAEFGEFGKRCRAPLYEAVAVNENTYKHFVKACAEVGLNFNRTEYVHFTGRKNEDIQKS